MFKKLLNRKNKSRQQADDYDISRITFESIVSPGLVRTPIPRPPVGDEEALDDWRLKVLAARGSKGVNTDSFTWLYYIWDVSAALELLEGASSDIQVNVGSFYNTYIVKKGFVVDHWRVSSADLSRPLIVASFCGTPLLIDGIHRLYKAYHQGIAELPAYYLTPNISKLFRLDDTPDEPEELRKWLG